MVARYLFDALASTLEGLNDRRAPSLMIGRPSLLAAIVAVAAAFALTACGERKAESAPPVVTADPAATFAPVVHLNARELWWPIGARDFIDFAIVSWSNEPCPIDDEVAIGRSRSEFHVQSVPIVDLRRLGQGPGYSIRPEGHECQGRRAARYSTTQSTRPYTRGRPAGIGEAEGFHLDVATARRSGRRQVSRDDGQAYLDGVPVYVDRRRERVDGRAGLRLSYWMLFGFERPLPEARGLAVEHEGDWERLDVLLQRGAGPRTYVPVAIQLSVRDARHEIPWRDVLLARGGKGSSPTHPVVFGGRGSHELYSREGRYDEQVPSPDGPIEVVDIAVACASCPAWRTWRALRPLRAEPWWGYRGAWGQAGDTSFATGAPGPAPLTSEVDGVR